MSVSKRIVLLGLFTLEMLTSVQQALIEPFTALLAKISAGLILPFDNSVLAHGKVLQFGDLAPSAKSARVERRRMWLDGALRATEECSLVFVVAPAPVDRDHLRARLQDLERSHWADELVVYWAADRP